jgi:HK97 family phage major capsid protein
MPLYTPAGSGGPIVRPEEVGELVVRPVQRESVAFQISTVANTDSHDYRIPIVDTDPVSAWVAEGAEITPSDPGLEELIVTPAKVAGLTIISNELAADSDPEAGNMVGQALARDIARRVDEAFFGALAAPAPSGLGAVTGTATAAATLDFGNGLDAFAEAISDAESVGATITAFCANPADALTLAQLRDETGSNRPLLGVDATNGTSRTILGVPLFVSPAVPANTLWAIPRDRVWVVLRNDTTLTIDGSAYFSSDRVGIRATMRVAFGFPHAAALGKITVATV